jgi:heat-inducible transcriptional repressor
MDDRSWFHDRAPSEPRALDARKASVLKAIVEEYIATAQPVASQHIARTRTLGVSSATVRNDMTVLERDGYLVQPHTSAGRVPTDKGYRFFVDQLGRPDPSMVPQFEEVAGFFARAQRALEDTLHETSLLLSRITDHTAVVIGPQAEKARVRSVQLVPLSAHVLLAVVVLSNGVVEKAAIDVPEPLSEVVVADANRALNELLTGGALAELDPRTGPVGEPGTQTEVQLLVTKVAEALAEQARDAGEPVYVGGASRIAAERPDFAAGDTVSRVLEMLERQYVVVTLVRDLIDAGLTVRIGAENDLEELRECSVVLAPYEIEGEPAGTVGVLGPTRMNYPQAISAVAVVSQRLGRHLSR